MTTLFIFARTIFKDTINEILAPLLFLKAYLYFLKVYLAFANVPLDVRSSSVIDALVVVHWSA